VLLSTLKINPELSDHMPDNPGLDLGVSFPVLTSRQTPIYVALVPNPKVMLLPL
jgi:hypothetical protein